MAGKQTITDEINIKALGNEYEPRPKWKYKYLQRKAPESVIAEVRTQILPKLKGFADKTASVALAMQTSRDSISTEWEDGIEITGLRALHRYYTTQFILARREAKLHKQHFNGDSLLQKAIAVRMQAQEIVNRRQQHYRWPLSLIAAKRWDHTAYHFGYLYLASNLHLWHREEEEARKNKYSFNFMNVWSIGRIIGIIK